MFVVIPSEELSAECVRVLLRAKTAGEVRSILERLELAFRKRIVIGDVRTAVRFRDAKSAEQLGHAVRFHRRTAVAVDDQLILGDALFLHRLADQPLGQVALSRDAIIQPTT